MRKGRMKKTDTEWKYREREKKKTHTEQEEHRKKQIEKQHRVKKEKNEQNNRRKRKMGSGREGSAMRVNGSNTHFRFFFFFFCCCSSQLVLYPSAHALAINTHIGHLETGLKIDWNFRFSPPIAIQIFIWYVPTEKKQNSMKLTHISRRFKTAIMHTLILWGDDTMHRFFNSIDLAS